MAWSLTGGYLSAGRLALRPPRLAIYADGSVIADATYRSDLTSATIADLITQLQTDLHGTDVTWRSDEIAQVVDAPVTVLTIRSTQGSQVTSAAAVDELRAKNGYPAELYDALDRLLGIHQRVVTAGQPYTSTRVRLVTEPGSTAPTPPQPWPSTLAMPQRQGMGGARLDDLDDQRAREAVRTVTRDVELNGAWTGYRTPSGEIVRASWRYLLPDE
mgnify:FL=1